MNRLRGVRFSRALCARRVALLVGLLAGVSWLSADPASLVGPSRRNTASEKPKPDAEDVVTHPGLTRATDAAGRAESLVLVVFGSRKSSAA